MLSSASGCTFQHPVSKDSRENLGAANKGFVCFVFSSHVAFAPRSETLWLMDAVSVSPRPRPFLGVPSLAVAVLVSRLTLTSSR